MSSVADLLRRASLTEGLPAADLELLASRAQELALDAGELLFREGEPRRLFALVVAGAIAIEKEVSGRPERLAVFGPGEALGESVFLDDSRHGTSARAVERSRCLVLSTEAVHSLLDERPLLYAALVSRAGRIIAQRLRRADATLVGRGRTLGFAGTRTRIEHDLLGE